MSYSVFFKRQLKEAKNIPNVEKLAKEVSNLTDGNHHTESLLLIAKTLKLHKYEKILEGIKLINEAENHLPSQISDYRYKAVYQPLVKILKEYGTDGEQVISGL